MPEIDYPRERDITQLLKSVLDKYAVARQQYFAQQLGDEPIQLSAILRGAIGDADTEAVRLEHPRLDDDIPAHFLARIVDEFATCIADVSKGLVGKSRREALGAALASFVPSNPGADVMREAIALRIAPWLLPDFNDATTRSVAIAQLVLKEEPTEPVGRYLKRLARCYIAGFDSECVILCRAVVENAVSARFEREGHPMPSQMRARVSLARTKGWLSRENEKGVMDVWVRGNKAIHADPELVKDVTGTLRLTLTATSELLAPPVN